MVETKKELEHLLKTATDSIKEASIIADQDMKRPKYHFRAPSQWMDDPNGIIYHNGYYHMMYSWNPNSDSHRAGMVYKTAHRIWDPNHEDWTGGITVWGHARSKDLIHWEHLPIALYPIIEKGEHFIWFGTTAINDNGVPVAIYTSVGPEKRPEDTADQWLWFGDNEMIRWEPAKENPILDYSLHEDEVLTEWRDPFVVKNEEKTYLILGARRLKEDGNDDAVVVLYEAQNADYTKWSYKGVIFSLGEREVPSCECPNLIKMQDKWALIISPHGKVEYYIGDMDFENAHFESHSMGIVDHSTNFYATNVMEDCSKRKIMYGAIEGFCNTKGWNGCVSLPREIRLEESRLIQKPAEELKQLRTTKESSFVGRLNSEVSRSVGTIKDGTAEILLKVSSEGLVKMDVSKEENVSIIFSNGNLLVAEKKVLLEDKKMNAHIFIDRTIIEIFLDNGECITVVLPNPILDETVTICAKDADADIEMEIYNLECDDLFHCNMD